MTIKTRVDNLISSKKDLLSSGGNSIASSLIRINEATADELQLLSGIGPKRAEHILVYRSNVSTLYNSFDLASATGISLSSAERLSALIDWQSNHQNVRLNLWPFLIAITFCIYIIFSGFTDLTGELFHRPLGYFNLALALILLSTLAATGDLLFASMTRRPSGSTIFFQVARWLFYAGISSLLIMTAASFLVTFNDDLVAKLTQTLKFLSYCGLILWLILGPGLCLRMFIADERLGILDASRNVYEISNIFVPIYGLLTLFLWNGPLWIEEAFCLCCIAITSTNSWLLSHGNSAFISMLSDLDRSRLRFIYNRKRRPTDNQHNLAIGWFSFAAMLTLLIFGLASFA
jgi:competence ComEA-like helix-hairpin-helix protein